ncbi:MAG: TrmH family RNA methyltransferase [Actinomycetaceae bacterium]|nr:TrmH family RNA methyltransferase [Actinomycetaceae bacterium]MDU0969809.1 TrmH family RNA methyltransferase [Actinomycetaceae bacterium]
MSGGVGPWPGGPAHWPEGDHFDPVLLAEGDHRNVEDRFRYWKRDAVRDFLDQQRHPFHVAVENLDHDFNIGSIVRSANAFGAAAVHIVGRRRWNRRGAMVTDRYQHVDHFAEAADFAHWALEAGLAIVAIDNVESSTPLETAQLPEQCCLVFGSENSGISDELRSFAVATHHITQYGSTRSINVGAAAAVAMYQWVLSHARPPIGA